MNGLKVTLKLKIIETNEWDAEFTRAEHDKLDNTVPIPTFKVETGEGTVDYKPQFVCPACNTIAYTLNTRISYDEDEELLYIENLAEDSLLGLGEPVKYKEPELPKIQRISQLCQN